MKTILITLLLFTALSSQSQEVFKVSTGHVKMHTNICTVQSSCSDQDLEKAYFEIRRLLTYTRPRAFRAYDIYITTPSGIFYANYSFQKKLTRI